LILDQKALKAARDYEMQLDELDDSVMGLKVSLGRELMPILLDVTNALKNGITAWSGTGQQWEEINYLLSKKYNPGLYELETRLRKANQGMTEAEIISQKLARAIPAVTGEVEDLSSAMKEQVSRVGAFSSEYKNYSTNLMTLEEEAAALIKERSELIAGGYKKNKDAIAEVDAAIQENIQKVRENQEAHTLATRTIMLGYLEQQLGIDGLSEKETAFLIEQGIQWGIYSDTAIEEMKRAQREVDILTGKLNGIPTSINVGINISGAIPAAIPSWERTSDSPLNIPAEEEVAWDGRQALGGSIPAGGMAWVGDSPSGLTPHSELVYAPHGAQVFNSNQSRSMGAGGSPRAFTGGMIPGASGEMTLSSETIRQLASSIANEVRRANG
jgi:hypothetical protein